VRGTRCTLKPLGLPVGPDEHRRDHEKCRDLETSPHRPCRSHHLLCPFLSRRRGGWEVFSLKKLRPLNWTGDGDQAAFCWMCTVTGSPAPGTLRPACRQRVAESTSVSSIRVRPRMGTLRCQSLKSGMGVTRRVPPGPLKSRCPCAGWRRVSRARRIGAWHQLQGATGVGPAAPFQGAAF